MKAIWDALFASYSFAVDIFAVVLGISSLWLELVYESYC